MPQRIHTRVTTEDALQPDVDRLKPFFERAGATPAPGPVSDAGQEGEHEVELLLNRRLVRGVTRYLVRWRGHTSVDDEWLRAEELAHCQDKVAEYDAAAPRRHAARRADLVVVPAAAPPAAPPHAGPISRRCLRPPNLLPRLWPWRRRPSGPRPGSGSLPRRRS